MGGRSVDLDSLSTERQAAVAVILRASEAPAADAEVLLVRRAERAGDPWSGHMALPGGRREPGDSSLFVTAVRETREEVGFDLGEHGVLLGRLPDVPAVARGKRVGMVVVPFVFALRSERPEVVLRLNEELVEAMWTPVGPLARGEMNGTTAYLHEGQPFDMPCYRVGDRVVWGLTHRMLGHLFEALHQA